MPSDDLLDATEPLLSALTELLGAQRYLHPGRLLDLQERLALVEGPLRAAADAFPADGGAVEEGLHTSLDLACKAVAGFRAASVEDFFAAARALRYVPYAMEALYPAASVSPAVSAFFLEDFRHGDMDFQARLAEPLPNTGVVHIENARGSKGGYSLYVPETCHPAEPHPVVVALHGGSGHGRAFLWTWLKEARSRGLILVSPTARGDTWSLMGPDIDSENLEAILERVRTHWFVDEGRLLLTGMSDGGTFTYVSGLRAASPFTHLAPISASFHPMLLEMIDRPRVAGRKIYITHGAQDWMFDVEVAHVADQILGAYGAQTVLREIPDLAHTYPRDENPRILDWFLSG